MPAIKESARQKYEQVEARKLQSPAQPSAVERNLKFIIVGGLFAGLALSPNLWLSERLYPLTPVFPWLGAIPSPFDFASYLTLLVLLLAIAAVKRPAKLIGCFSLLAITVALFDQSRWQPWFYQYLAMLVALGLYDYKRGEDDDIHNPALNACRLIVACTYLWSGLQKAHAGFATDTVPFLIHPLQKLFPAWSGSLHIGVAVIAPIVETSIGIGLLTRRFRKVAIVTAFGMHAFILLRIGPFGANWNTVVWPWNIAMLCFLLVLFWRSPGLSVKEIVWPRRRFQLVILLLFGVAPLFSFLNWWDAYLSSALYSGTRNTATIYVKNALADRLPPEILRQVFLTKKPGINEISLVKWAMREQNVAVYPEPRIYRNVARSLCAYAHDPSELKLVIAQTDVLFSPDRQLSYDCPALLK